MVEFYLLTFPRFPLRKKYSAIIYLTIEILLSGMDDLIVFLRYYVYSTHFLQFEAISSKCTIYNLYFFYNSLLLNKQSVMQPQKESMQ